MKILKLFLYLILIFFTISLAFSQDSEDLYESFNNAPTSENFQKLPNPTSEDFQKLPNPTSADFQKLPSPTSEDFQKLTHPTSGDFQKLQDPNLDDFGKLTSPILSDFQKLDSTEKSGFFEESIDNLNSNKDFFKDYLASDLGIEVDGLEGNIKNFDGTMVEGLNQKVDLNSLSSNNLALSVDPEGNIVLRDKSMGEISFEGEVTSNQDGKLVFNVGKFPDEGVFRVEEGFDTSKYDIIFDTKGDLVVGQNTYTLESAIDVKVDINGDIFTFSGLHSTSMGKVKINDKYSFNIPENGVSFLDSNSDIDYDTFSTKYDDLFNSENFIIHFKDKNRLFAQGSDFTLSEKVGDIINSYTLGANDQFNGIKTGVVMVSSNVVNLYGDFKLNQNGYAVFEGMDKKFFASPFHEFIDNENRPIYYGEDQNDLNQLYIQTRQYQDETSLGSIDYKVGDTHAKVSLGKGLYKHIEGSKLDKSLSPEFREMMKNGGVSSIISYNSEENSHEVTLTIDMGRGENNPKSTISIPIINDELVSSQIPKAEFTANGEAIGLFSGIFNPETANEIYASNLPLDIEKTYEANSKMINGLIRDGVNVEVGIQTDPITGFRSFPITITGSEDFSKISLVDTHMLGLVETERVFDSGSEIGAFEMSMYLDERSNLVSRLDGSLLKNDEGGPIPIVSDVASAVIPTVVPDQINGFTISSDSVCVDNYNTGLVSSSGSGFFQTIFTPVRAVVDGATSLPRNVVQGVAITRCD